MRVYDAFETSETLTKEGVECQIVYAGKTIAKVRVLPADLVLNSAFRIMTEELANEIRGQRKGEDVEPSGVVYYRLFIRTVIKSIEWIDPQDKKDPSLKFNEENMVALFKRAPKFFSAIEKVAMQWTNYKAEFEEETAGN